MSRARLELAVPRAAALEVVTARQVRPSTSRMRLRAVEDAVATMRARYGDALSLDELAGVACLSPYHFCRVFHACTGIPPGRFLTAVRMEAATRLLVTTDIRVSEVCIRVGYRSVGTFTTQFGQLVGLAPRTLRRRSAVGHRCVPRPVAASAATVRGTVVLPAGEDRTRPVYVGLFRGPAVHGRPAAWRLLERPGAFALPIPPPGAYHLCAASLPPSAQSLDDLLAGDGRTLVAVAGDPVRVRAGATARIELPLSLRSMRLIDPPILAALPVLSEPSA
jgi:AraC family transcriptional regulator